MDLELIKKEFDKYVNLFDKNDYDIKYKYNHSYRVMELSNLIAKSLNLSDEDVMLATIIGLLHDIGRFKQLEMFGSYDDKNIDHADLGVKILFEEGLIREFKIESKYYDIIRFAIGNHNKLNIENTNDEIILMHSKLIRDADKIDILKTHTIFKDYKLKECEDDISDKVKQSFYKNESVKNSDKNNLNDKIILILSFVFDINFDISINYIKKEKLIEKLYKRIENKNIFKPYFKYIGEYINERNR